MLKTKVCELCVETCTNACKHIDNSSWERDCGSAHCECEYAEANDCWMFDPLAHALSVHSMTLVEISHYECSQAHVRQLSGSEQMKLAGVPPLL